MLVVPNNFGDLLLPGFRKIWGDEFNMYPEEYASIFETDTSTRSFEEDHSITTLGLIQEKAVGRGVTYDTTYNGWTKRYTHLTYGLGFSVAREMLEDDLYGKMKKMPKALGRSTRHTLEIIGANVLNRAFSGSYLGGDGKALCASDHPLFAAGSTFSNMPSIASDLSITSYEQALIDIQMNWYDDRGLKIAAKPQKLIIHPSEWFTAEMILKSAQLPDTNDNNINPAKGTMPGGYVTMHWLTDPNAWFVKTDIPNGLTWFWRRRPEFTQDNDFDSENAKYKVTFRASCGWTDPRCIYGNAGS